jgi:hypothetical protein
MNEIIAERTTFDGVTVYIHADGKISTRNLDVVYGVKFSPENIFRAADEMCLYDFAELKSLASRKFTVRPRVGKQMELMAIGSRDRMERLRTDLTYNRNPWKRTLA